MSVINPSSLIIGLVRFTRGAKSAASAIASVGFKAIEYGRAITSLGDKVANLNNKWMDLQDIAFKTARSMGMSRTEAMRMDRQLMEQVKELGRAYGTSARDIAEYQKDYASATGRNIQLTKMQMEQMVALGNITDNATASKLVDEFDTLGVSVEDTLAYTGQLQERAKFLGLNATKASKTLAENINLAASYSFRNGINDIERMVLQSQSLKMNMQATMTAADKFSNIQDAITTSANIQMLGGGFAQQFSNPMGALYESMADPAAFQDRLIKTIEGKGTYNRKTNQVTFDPVTMAQMKEMSKQLGISVEELTKPAMAQAQNKAVEREISGRGWSKEQQQAIEDLSRTNFDEKTGKHFVKLLDQFGNEKRVNVEDLTEEQLKQAQDSALTQDKMWADVHAIKEKIVGTSMGRARETRSQKENLRGFGESWNGAISQIENIIMPTVSGILNGGNGLFGNLAGMFTRLPGMNPFYSRPIFGSDMGQNHYAEGGIVHTQHAEEGTIVGGDSYMGDQVPVMANSGEMIMNPQQQNGLFNLLSTLGKIGAGAFLGNKIGKKLGVGNIGTQGVVASTLMGGDMLSSMMQIGIAKKIGPLGGMMMGMNPIEAILMNAINSKQNSPVMPQMGFDRNGINVTNGTINLDTGNINGFGRFTSTIDNIGKNVSDTADQISDFKSTFKDFRQKWGMGGRFGKTRIGKAIRLTGNKMTQFGDLSRSAFKGGGKMISGLVGGIGKRIPLIGGALSAIGAIGDIKTTLSDKSLTGKEKRGAIGGVVGSVAGTALMSLIPGIGPIVGPMLGPVIGKAVGGFIGKMIPKMPRSFKTLFKGIGDAGLSLINGIGNLGKGAAKGIANVLGGVASVGGSIAKGAIGLGSTAVRKASNVGKGILGGVATGAKVALALSPIGLLGNAVKGVANVFDKFGESKPKLSDKFTEKDYLKKISDTLTNTLTTPKIGLKSEAPKVASIPVVGKKEYISNSIRKESLSPTAVKFGPQDINLNVSGTIKLDLGGKQANIDPRKLLDSPEFRNQIAEIVSRRLNDMGNGGKYNKEGNSTNTKGMYNRVR